MMAAEGLCHLSGKASAQSATWHGSRKGRTAVRSASGSFSEAVALASGRFSFARAIEHCHLLRGSFRAGRQHLRRLVLSQEAQRTELLF